MHLTMVSPWNGRYFGVPLESRVTCVCLFLHLTVSLIKQCPPFSVAHQRLQESSVLSCAHGQSLRDSCVRTHYSDPLQEDLSCTLSIALPILSTSELTSAVIFLTGLLPLKTLHSSATCLYHRTFCQTTSRSFSRTACQDLSGRSVL